MMHESQTPVRRHHAAMLPCVTRPFIICIFPVHAFAAPVTTKTLSGVRAWQRTERDTNRLATVLLLRPSAGIESHI